MELSNRAKKLKPSPTLQLAARAKELQSQGKDIISLSVGEPDWPTFEVALEAGIAALRAGHTKYGPAAGLPELRKVVAQRTSQEVGLDFQMAEVTVSAGGKFVIFSALQCLINPGDEVLIPAPYWVSYPTMVELADGKPVIIPTQADADFRMTAADLEKAITPKTRLLILNSPSNPTGETYSLAELKELTKVLQKHPNVFVMSDDIYNRLVFDGTGLAPHILQADPGLRARTVLINGASKSLSMTGWRVGWAIGPEPLIKAMTDYQSQSVSCASSFSQLAAVAALQKCDAEIRGSVESLRQRRDFALERLRKIPGVKVAQPGGAFYLWPSIEPFIGTSFAGKKIKDSSDFCSVFLDAFGVAVVPGKEFGTEGYLRMSYVLNEKRMSEAFDRLERFVSQLS